MSHEPVPVMFAILSASGFDTVPDAEARGEVFDNMDAAQMHMIRKQDDCNSGTGEPGDWVILPFLRVRKVNKFYLGEA